MNQSLSRTWQWLQTDLRRPAVLISLLLSAWAIMVNDVINIDGILYLDVAHHISNWDWPAASAIYHWHFYPMLIALLHKLSWLGLESSALLINNLFIAGLVWVFLSTLKLLDADRNTMIAGLVLILIHPYINDYRADVIRGPGFWFFMLLGLYLLIKMQLTSQYRYAILMSIAFILAMLFRVEGMAYLLLAPLILLTSGNAIRLRLKLLASAYFIPACSVLLVLVAWAISGDAFSISSTHHPIGKINHPFELMRDAYHSLTTKIPAKGDIIATQVLNIHSENFGVAGVIATLTVVLVSTIIKRITLLVLVLSILGHMKTRIVAMPAILWLSLINIGYMAAYVVHEFFLSSRFAMPAALFLAIPASYGLAYLFRRLDHANMGIKVARTIVALLAVFMLLDGLVSTGTSKAYLREGGYWVKEHMNPGEKLLTNQFTVKHYAGIRMTFDERSSIEQFDTQLNQGNVNADLLKTADHIAIRTKHIQPETLSLINNALSQYKLKEFSSSRKERLLIYSKR